MYPLILASVSAEDLGESTPATETFSSATATLLQQVTEGDFSQILSYGAAHLAPAVLAAGLGLSVIFLGYLLASYLMHAISRPICRRVDETLGKFVGRMVFYVVLFGVVGVVLAKLGAPLGGLAAMLAAAGFAIGLAFQGTLSNFASGVLMLVFRPFKVGDFVNAAGIAGRVDEIDLFTTTLDTPDNRRLIVPNSAIAGGTIENMTYHRHRRVEVCVGVAYSADLNATREALTAAVGSLADKMIDGENRGCAVVLAGLGSSSVDWKVRLWVAAGDFWPMTEALIAAVKNHLDAAGIGIPFPQMDVHLIQAAAANAVTVGPRQVPTATATEGAIVGTAQQIGPPLQSGPTGVKRLRPSRTVPERMAG